VPLRGGTQQRVKSGGKGKTCWTHWWMRRKTLTGGRQCPRLWECLVSGVYRRSERFASILPSTVSAAADREGGMSASPDLVRFQG